MTHDLLFSLNKTGSFTNIGNKAANIQHLGRLGMRVPVTFVLTWEAYRRYLANDLNVIAEITAELEKKLDPGKSYAVRSSANIEDSFEHSFAGQFKTVLEVQGREALIQAIWSIWATAQTPAVQNYLQRHNLGEQELKMAVIIQEMVRPVISGVAFSRNPMTGIRQTVVEAVHGLGTRLVQEGVTPKRWIFHSGEFIEKPDDDDIPLALIEEVVAGARKLSRRLKRDIDLEWVYDGQSLYWVQMREITTLRSVQVYSNRISKEMMAGIIKPLIWSVNIPLVNGAWIRMLTEAIGPNQLEPFKLARIFYYRAYFNMGLLGEVFEDLGIPAESLEIMWGLVPRRGKGGMFKPGPEVLRLLPRLVRFIWDKWTLAGRLEDRLPALEAGFREINIAEADRLSPAELLVKIDRLYQLNQEAAYYNIVLPLTMYIYNTVLRSQMKKIGVDYARLHMHQDTPEFQRFNPNWLIERLNREFQALEPDLQERVRRGTFAEAVVDPGLNGFREGLADLLARFGHLSDNGNDFSTVPWREDADTILRVVIDYQPGQKEREKAGAAEKIDLNMLRLPLWNGWMVRRLYRRTRRYNLFRERISYIYTYGYGLFREYFLAIGRHLVRQGLLEAADDIFYLEWPQIRQLAREGGSSQDVHAQVEHHKREIDRVRDLALPTIIYGDQPPPVEETTGRTLSGTATSRGYCTGRVKVVTGIQDFPKMAQGDILVIPYSDVGWTPLFARAVGVIAESGGMLSHSSIIAREYGIPAIVSVNGAMQLKDGILVSMDGYNGEIRILEEEGAAIASPERK